MTPPPSSCPYLQSSNGRTNKDWWPEQLNLKILSQHNERTNPLAGQNVDYASDFQSLDLEAVKTDLRNLMTDSQDWWPADYGHYGPFFIRYVLHIHRQCVRVLSSFLSLLTATL